MAASFYSNSVHVDFDSVLKMDEPGMVSMFQALVASGLQGFLGCTAVVYEEALVDFFANGTVRDGLVVSSVDGVLVEISEELFVETFELPVDGLGDLSEMPKDVIFDARSILSLSGESISLSGRKNQMKFEFRLLCDIMAKAISVKVGSFNAITVEKFSLITAVVCRIRMNWAKFLFSILKKMVTPGSNQAKGFAIQISLLLATIPTLELDGAEEVTGAAKKRAASKKRPVADVGAAVPKKKRNIKKKYVSSLEMVAVAEEAVPIQQVAEPSAVEEIRYPSADDVDLIIQQVLDETREVDAPADKAQPVATEEKLWYDLPYEDIVAKWEAERPVVTASDTDEEIATIDVAPADGDQQVQESVAPISNDDMLSADERMSLDDIILTIPVDIPLPSSNMEITKIMMGKSIKIPGVTKWTWFLKSLPSIPADDKGKGILVEKDPIRGNPAREHFFFICTNIDLLVELRAKSISVLLYIVDFSLFNWFPSADISEFLSSIALDRTVLRSVQSSQNSFSVVPSVQLSLDQHQSSSSSTDISSSLHFDQTDVDATASSLPPASQDLSTALADLQATLSEQIFEYESGLSSQLHKIEQSVCDSLRDQADIFRNLSQGARQEARTLDDVQTIRFNEFRKNILAQNASIFVGFADVRKEVEEVNAKVDIMASRLNDIQKDAEATKEALSH
ncbi:ICln family transporter: chloride ion current inducer protein I(Cln) [Dorcoceras hygrometricum]|uniref:ICln family transporter: chloride ion current inducer protein I(Cln) n=1 Tax=Dorcoceras hygrometricum TaxID=472368 RepID=A0A2Z7D2E7_9LAMI|nr:ICln family transporter: chloride ion current inducer protein I(Cln) [Dorcoceras hygrometricum]